MLGIHTPQISFYHKSVKCKTNNFHKEINFLISGSEKEKEEKNQNINMWCLELYREFRFSLINLMNLVAPNFLQYPGRNDLSQRLLQDSRLQT